jgi:hypothetical protein
MWREVALPEFEVLSQHSLGRGNKASENVRYRIALRTFNQVMDSPNL